MKLSHVKLFSFNAGSFSLDPSVEGFLKSKGAISLDFGATAYINSEAMPIVLSELVDKNTSADLVANLSAEVGKYGAERQKIMEDNARLASQVQLYSAEIATLKEQAADAARQVEMLRVENVRLQAAMKNTQQAQENDKLKQSYEKLQKEFHDLRIQHAEAIASLKVLEDENGELMRELELLKNQSKTAAVEGRLGLI